MAAIRAILAGCRSSEELASGVGGAGESEVREPPNVQNPKTGMSRSSAGPVDVNTE